MCVLFMRAFEFSGIQPDALAQALQTPPTRAPKRCPSLGVHQPLAKRYLCNGKHTKLVASDVRSCFALPSLTILFRSLSSIQLLFDTPLNLPSSSVVRYPLRPASILHRSGFNIHRQLPSSQTTQTALGDSIWKCSLTTRTAQEKADTTVRPKQEDTHHGQSNRVVARAIHDR